MAAPRAPLFSAISAIALGVFASCQREPKTTATPDVAGPSTSTSWRSPALASSEPPAPSESAPAERASAVPASASASAAPAPAESASAAAATPPEEIDWKNKAKPDLESDDLQAKAKSLLEAIRTDDPKLAAGFFFPREPFTPLKDVKDPDRYWRQLFRAYENDIHELHRKHAKDWDDAKYVSFALGSPPKWVKPGEEANKIGYYRTFAAKLRYDARGKERELEVKVIISWQKGWFITHLLPFKK